MNGLRHSLACLVFALSLQIGQTTKIAHVYPNAGEEFCFSKIKDAVNLDL